MTRWSGTRWAAAAAIVAFASLSTATAQQAEQKAKAAAKPRSVDAASHAVGRA